MIRLFLKFYGVLLATLVFSFVVQMQLMDYVWREFAVRYDFRARFVPTFHLLDEALAGLSAPERAARFESLARGFGLPARLVPLDALPERARFKPEQAEVFERGNIVALDREGGGFTLVRRLRSGDGAIAMDYYGTDSQRVKMITYLVNWSVEFAIVAVLVFFWVRPFWRELLTLRGAAEDVGAGRFETRAEVGRHSVLRPFAEAFNAMTQH
ncbi:MAG TPA: hypothetical protein VFD95_14100, partial [Usitatibacter sp.]|nr:hypothetical protein [Usitatibacter sp.]